jgi:phenylacetate-CoA ligase
MNIASNISRIISPPLFRIMGIDIFQYRRFLMDAEKWTAQERNEWRLAHLGNIIEHCWDHVPFYREFWSDHGIKIRRPRSFDELEVFPVINRDLFREHRDRIVADNLKVIPHKSDSTGGTTGSPLKYHHDLALHALRYGFAIIGCNFAGYNYGDEICTIAGGSIIPGQSTFRHRVRSWLDRGHGVSCVGMNRNVAKACADMIQRYEPLFLYGYPSMIAEFCNIIKQDHFQFRRLKAVFTTAEMLYPHYRRQIEETLGVSVFDHYGFNDGGLSSYECERHSGFHYNDIESIIEVTSKDDSGIGNFVITNLWNRSMPFVRYENGDLIALAQEQCPCGRVYPLIRSVEGRTGDILRFSNGNALGAPGLTLIFKEFPIDGWQVVQTGKDSIEIRIKSKQILGTEVEKYIRQIIQHHLAMDIEINILYVNQLASTSRGKLKPVFVEIVPEPPIISSDTID